MLHSNSTTRKIVVFCVYGAIFLLLCTHAGAQDVASASYILPPDINLKYDHVLDEEGTCNTSVIRRNGVVYSHAQALLQTERFDRLHYDDMTDCSLSVNVGTGWLVLVQFPQDIFLECSTLMCDCLHIHDGCSVSDPVLKSICGSHRAETIGPLVSHGSEVTFHFRSDRNCKRSLGFVVRYSAYRHETTDWPCDPEEEYRCDSDSCIPVRFRCDRITHCVDGSDEGRTGCNEVQAICQPLGRLRMHHLTVFLLIIFISTIIVFIICSYVCRHRGCRKECHGYWL